MGPRRLPRSPSMLKVRRKPKKHKADIAEEEEKIAERQKPEEAIWETKSEDADMDMPFLSKRQMQDVIDQDRTGCEEMAKARIDKLQQENMELAARLRKLDAKMIEEQAVTEQPKEAKTEMPS